MPFSSTWDPYSNPADYYGPKNDPSKINSQTNRSRSRSIVSVVVIFFLHKHKPF